jgi:hypothetical protein
MSQLHTCVEGKVIEIRNFCEWGVGTSGGDHQVGCCVFGGRSFGTRGCFLLGLPSSRLRVRCSFWLRLLRPGRLPGGGHFRLLGRLRDRLRGIRIRGGVAVALTTRPFGRRDSTHLPGLSAWQRARPAELSERQGGLWGRSFGHARAPALQEPPSLLYT